SQYCCLYFFFQAEDGIRDFHVTGVQTCALPIYLFHPEWIDKEKEMETKRRTAQPARHGAGTREGRCSLCSAATHPSVGHALEKRSEERRVGKECRSRWWRWH